ncbi:MAG: YdeI family protein [Bacteroidales bacterium]
METLFCKHRDEWRLWLEKNHTTASEIWLVYMKKHTKKQSVAYVEAVEETLCFGWIDSLVKSIDSESYIQKYTPRKNNSIWSLVNKKRVEKMIREKKMTKAGLEKVEIAKENGNWENAYSSKQNFETPDEFTEALKNNSIANSFFNKLSPSHQNTYIGYIVTTKRSETRISRIKKVIGLLEKGTKPGMI